MVARTPSPIGNSLLRFVREHGAPNTVTCGELHQLYGCSHTPMRMGSLARRYWKLWAPISDGVEAMYDRDRRRFVIRAQVTA